MKGKLLLIIGIAALLLLSGCTVPPESNIGDIAGIVSAGAGVGNITEAGFTQTCGERGGEVCGANEVCRGSVFWSVGSALGQFSCCDMTCGEMTADDECRTGADCDDGDSSTGDRCSGNPMKCSHVEMECDGPVCRSVRPLEVNNCGEANCLSNERCIEGACVEIYPRCVEDDVRNITRCDDEENCVPLTQKCVEGEYVDIQE